MPRPVRRHTPTQADGRPCKITFGEMREMGLRGVLVYCHCGHHVELSADRWLDEVRLSDVEPAVRLRPLWQPWRSGQAGFGKRQAAGIREIASVRGCREAARPNETETLPAFSPEIHIR
ncbi:hypothetical protein [Bradyrhizobium sp. USDA 4486]